MHFYEVMEVFSPYTETSTAIVKLNKGIIKWDKDDAMLITELLYKSPGIIRVAMALDGGNSLKDFLKNKKNEETKNRIIIMLNEHQRYESTLIRYLCDVLIESYAEEAIPQIIRFLHMQSRANILDRTGTDLGSTKCPPAPFYCEEAKETMAEYVIKELEKLTLLSYPTGIMKIEDKQRFWTEWYLNGGYEILKEKSETNTLY